MHLCVAGLLLFRAYFHDVNFRHRRGAQIRAHLLSQEAPLASEIEMNVEYYHEVDPIREASSSVITCTL